MILEGRRPYSKGFMFLTPFQTLLPYSGVWLQFYRNNPESGAHQWILPMDPRWSIMQSEVWYKSCPMHDLLKYILFFLCTFLLAMVAWCSLKNILIPLRQISLYAQSLLLSPTFSIRSDLASLAFRERWLLDWQWTFQPSKLKTWF